VAAHLEPEILIVDEVLAVGDAQFQQKCLGKMQNVSKSGRTVLFVSHNMAAIRQLCSCAILFTKGELVFQGGIRDGVSRHLLDGADNKIRWQRKLPLPVKPGIYFQEVRVEDQRGNPTEHFAPSETIRVVIELLATEIFARPQITLRFTNAEGIPVFCTCNTDHPGKFESFKASTHRFVVEIPAGLLMPGRYALHLGSHLPQDCGFDEIDNELSIEISSAGSTATVFGDNRPGVVVPVFPWRRE
jgi:lipopolysaccharide transport system ATP-binding protein